VRNDPGQGGRGRWKGDLVLVALVLVIGGLLLQPGIFSVDESHYLLAADALGRSGSFHIENGYEKLRDPALLYFYTVIPDRVDELGTVATVPPYHSLLAAPLVWLAGSAGAVWLNLLALAASLLAVRRLALRAGLAERAALACALAFAVGGVSLEYALGIWPHALSQALVVWSLLLVVVDEPPPRAWFVAGLLGGLATGVRLQNIVWLPVLSLLVLRARRPGRAALGWLAGWLPPLAGMALINWWRLDTPNPFTYGRGLGLEHTPAWRMLAARAGPMIMLAVVVLLLAVILVFLRRKGRLGSRGLVAAAAAGTLVLMAIPALRQVVCDYLGRLLYFLVDPALGPAGMRSAGGHTGLWGQVYYGGVLKKGLIETMPLAAAALYWLSPRGIKDRTSLFARRLLLAAVGALVLLPFMLSAGGWCYNPRYLLELVPALFVLGTAAFYGLPAGRTAILAGTLSGLMLALPVVLSTGTVESPADGRYQLVLALAVILVPTLTLAVWRFVPGRLAQSAGQAGRALMALAFVYGVMVQLGGDLATSNTVRRYAHGMEQAAEKVVSDGSLLFAWEARKDVFTPLKLERDIWIGGLRFRDTALPPSLVELTPNRRVFVLKNGIPPVRWREIARGRRILERRSHDLLFVELRLAGER